MSSSDSNSGVRRNASRTRRAARPVLEAFEPRTLLSLTPNGPQVDVDDYEFSYPAISAKDSSGNFVVAWTHAIVDSSGQPTQNNVEVQMFNSSDAPVWSAPVVVASTSAFRRETTVAMDKDDGIVVAWHQSSTNPNVVEDDLFAQRLDAKGNFVGSQFQVNSVTDGGGVYPAVASPQVAMAFNGSNEGYFVFTWSRTANQLGHVYARAYNSSGNPVTNEIAVDNVDNTAQLSSVGMDSNGNFEVAWGVQNGLPYYIYLEHFTPSGSGSGQQNTGYSTRNTVSTNRGPNVAMDPGGDFVVTWPNLYIQGQTGAEEGVWAIAYYANGTNSGLITVKDYHQPIGDQSPWIAPWVAIGSGSSGQRFVVAWSNIIPSGFPYAGYANVYASQYVLDPVSQLVSNQTIDVNPPSPFAPPYNMDFVEVGADPNNNVSLVWRGDTGYGSYGTGIASTVYLRSFSNGDASGPNGSPAGVTPIGTGYRSEPYVLRAGASPVDPTHSSHIELIGALPPTPNKNRGRGQPASPPIDLFGPQQT